MSAIILPWPPASLSGHAEGHWKAKAAATKQHREWARLATLAAKITAPAEGDIGVSITFIPPNRRSDRTNFANRVKPYVDGIADAMGVNDRRFLPSYAYLEPEKPGRVEFRIAPHQTAGAA